MRGQADGELHSRIIEKRIVTAKKKKARRFVRIASIISRVHYLTGLLTNCQRGLDSARARFLAPPEERLRSE